METAILIVAVIVGVFSGALGGWIARRAQPATDLRPILTRQGELARQVEAMGMTLASLAARRPEATNTDTLTMELAALRAEVAKLAEAAEARSAAAAEARTGEATEARTVEATEAPAARAEELATLRTELTGLGAELKAVMAALDAREAEAVALKRALAESDTAPLLSEIARLKQALAGSDVEALRAESARLQSRLEARDTELAGLRAHLTARATELALLKARQAQAAEAPVADLLMPRFGDEPADPMTALREELAAKEAEIASIRYASALRDMELAELRGKVAQA